MDPGYAKQLEQSTQILDVLWKYMEIQTLRMASRYFEDRGKCAPEELLSMSSLPTGSLWGPDFPWQAEGMATPLQAKGQGNETNVWKGEPSTCTKLNAGVGGAASGGGSCTLDHIEGSP